MRRLKRLLRIVRVRGRDFRRHWGRSAITFGVGLAILLALRIPLVEQSFVGAFDRQMMAMAFKLRADAVAGRADPVLFLDVDDRTLLGPAPAAYASPPNGAPRAVLADLLTFVLRAPTASRPGVVILDVDIAAEAVDGSDAVLRLREVLSAWSRTRGAPPLIIARQAYPAGAVSAPGEGTALPVSLYDDIVDPAPNIYWGTVRVLADKDNVTREFLPFECVRRPQGVRPLYSAALLAYGFVEEPAVLRDARAGRWMRQAEGWCAGNASAPPDHGELINYHLSLQRGAEGRTWPDMPGDWRGYRRCPRGDAAIFRQLSAADVVAAAQAGGAASDILCGRIVIIGGTNTAAADFVQTPLDDMAGPAVLANAIRGLQLSRGGLRQAPLLVQIALLLGVSLLISATFAVSHRARRRYARLKAMGCHRSIWRKASLLPMNPVVLNSVLAFAAHWLGVGLLMLSLDLGFWGYLSAPAFGAAMAETFQEFADA